MPWAIRKSGDKWEVYNKATGEGRGKSDTLQLAKDHLAALYAISEEDFSDKRKRS